MTYNAWVIQQALGFKDNFLGPGDKPIYGTAQQFDEVVQRVAKTIDLQAKQFGDIRREYG